MSPRYELVDGELLVTAAPAARHQRIIFRLALIVHAYCVREAIGEVRLGPGEFGLVPENRYEPDLLVVPAIDGRLPSAEVPRYSPLVCVVLSPSSLRHDRVTKRQSFQRFGVPEYWVVDGDAETFEIWHPSSTEAAVERERVAWNPEGATKALEIDVHAFFASVADGAPLEL
jgi:Uma2 family endonuclease